MLYHRINTTMRLCLSLTFSTLLSGCFYSVFKVKNVSDQSSFPATIEAARKNGRFFILHQYKNAYAISAMRIDSANQRFKMQVDILPTDHQLYAAHPNRRKYRERRGERGIVQEIHL